MKAPYIISSLLAAGFGEPGPNPSDLSYFQQQAAASSGDGIEILAEQSLTFTLAGHRSHSSHGSHASHGSHRSSTGGGVTIPRVAPTPVIPRVTTPSVNRNRDSVPSSTVLPRTPSDDASVTVVPTLPALKGNTKAFIALTRKIQLHLYALGYYSGALDGLLGTDSKAAIAKYQKDKGLPITGIIDDRLVASLGITKP